MAETHTAQSADARNFPDSVLEYFAFFYIISWPSNLNKPRDSHANLILYKARYLLDVLA